MVNKAKKQINEAELAKEMRKYVVYLSEQHRSNSEEAKNEAKEALIRTGVLTKRGNSKEKIVSWE